MLNMEKEKDFSAPNAMVLNIQRLSTEDGPGVRTTVFLKGCSLSCEWCHNPESIHPYKEVQWFGTKCIGCRSCVNICPDNAVIFREDGIFIDREKCSRCLLCVKECPSTAMEVKGEEWELDKLVDEVIKDRAYFEKSKGGITVSGGEALCQWQFTTEFFKRLKELGIHTTLDTCGMCSKNAITSVLPYTDLVLFDLKLMDPQLHKKFTGTTNQVVLENVKSIAETIRKNGYPSQIWIRTPVIPNATADDNNIIAIGEFISENLNDVISRWDLCAFNNLCDDKYKRLDREWAFREAKLIPKEEMERLAQLAKSTGVNPEIVFWSGPTRVDD